MTGVRRKKAQRNKRINTTKPGLKRKKKDKKVKVLNQTLQKNWDQKKTLKQNLRDLGLAFDANTAVPIPKRKVKLLQSYNNDDSTSSVTLTVVRVSQRKISSQKLEKVEEMEIDNEPTSVIKEFEQMAANEVKGERHISPGEAQFLWQLIQDHGNNYKDMARDKRNCYQHTPKQLKRKCEAFLRSKQDFSGHLENVG